MSWVPFVFNLCLALLFAGYVVYRVRRFERAADRIMAGLDQRHEERMRALEAEAAEDRSAFRASIDRLVAESEEQLERSNAQLCALVSSFSESTGDADAATEPRTVPR